MILKICIEHTGEQNQVKNKKMTEEKFWEKYNAWKNHASHGNCKKLCASMDEFVKELMENANICAGANKGE